MPYGQARRLPAPRASDRQNQPVSPNDSRRSGILDVPIYGLAPVAATVVAAAHPRVAAAHHRPAGAIWRRRDVRIDVGDGALTVDYYLTGLANLGDGGGCADHCGYRKPCGNRRQE